jgi:hypothetical protein
MAIVALPGLESDLFRGHRSPARQQSLTIRRFDNTLTAGDSDRAETRNGRAMDECPYEHLFSILEGARDHRGMED